MKVDPVAERDSFIRTLQRAYGISVKDMQFFPTEWLAYCYIVECVSGERYYLKAHAESEPSLFVASSRDFYLPLTYELYTTGVLPHIPHPIMTQDGKFIARCGAYLLILFSYIEADMVGLQGLTDEVLAKLATSVATLHRSTPQLDLQHPLIERFDIVFEDALLDALEVLADATIMVEATAGAHHLRDLLLSHKDTLLGYLDRLKALQRTAKETHGDMVVCHTDLHGENLMLDAEGNLYILDWENAMIAPPEHDLFFFAGEEDFWQAFFPYYARVFGPVDLNSDIFGFYYYRRGLEDMTCWILRILQGEGHAARDQADLEEVAGCLAGMALIEKTMVQIKNNLMEVQTCI